MNFAGKSRWLMILSCAVSVISTVIGVIPYIYIFFIMNELFKSNRNLEVIENYGWSVVFISILGIVVYFIALMLSHLVAFKIEKNIRKQSMEKLFKLPFGYFKNHNSGELRKKMDENATLTHMLVAHNTPDMAGAVIFPILMVGMLLYFDWRLGIISILSVIFSFFLMLPMWVGKNKNCVSEYMDAQESMNNSAVEFVRGIPVVKIFQQTIYSFKDFHKAIKYYAEFSLQYAFMARKWMLFSNLMIHASLYVMVPAGIILLMSGSDPVKITINVLFYIIFSAMCTATLLKILDMSQSSNHANEVIKRLDEIFDSEEMTYGDIKEVNDYDVSFEYVHFKYPETDKEAISGVNLKVSSGEVLALVGESGGGKSTLASLIPRFYDVDSGSIKIGNIDVKEFSREGLMDKISFVFQNNKLFKESLFENVKKGKTNASEKEVIRACHLAQCDDILNKFPDGIHTVVGSKGVYLSGGEEQRIILARAILKDAPILILDEATAFADPENEYLIQKAFKELMKNKTVVMIAHRLSSVVSADKIAVISDGKIEELGKHDELIAMGGVYSRMWNEYGKSATWKLMDGEVTA